MQKYNPYWFTWVNKEKLTRIKHISGVNVECKCHDIWKNCLSFHLHKKPSNCFAKFTPTSLATLKLHSLMRAYFLNKGVGPTNWKCNYFSTSSSLCILPISNKRQSGWDNGASRCLHAYLSLVVQHEFHSQQAH